MAQEPEVAARDGLPTELLDMIMDNAWYSLLALGKACRILGRVALRRAAPLVALRHVVFYSEFIAGLGTPW
ncbi:hypothetical protein P691DRAFT_800788 [Macrolepiota fuliginosa MF-IS2]|uniref:F-box domain-containing protein n=1 Tax=Macrolepiota fuliginosa MF-IS2 TaxID=1400762 RepID=A0A9P5XD40_9AGAR|nr:hypothetical protein P691DRAFT_800788 [Macrolepiota fuliginosa MF-IS2]